MEDGYHVTTGLDTEWAVSTPNITTISFKRDTGFCYHMLYIDLQENHKEAFAMIKTVRGKFEGYTENQIEGAKLARQVQSKNLLNLE